MVIQHKQLQGKGMFYVGQDGAILAEMVYTMAPNKMIIEHTEVDESLEGKGRRAEGHGRGRLPAHALCGNRRHPGKDSRPR